MTDDTELLRQQLQDAGPDDAYSALIAIGKKGAPALEADVARYLTDDDTELRSAAIRVLAFYWELPAYQETANRMIEEETDPAPRSVAIMAWTRYWRDSRSPQAMRRLFALLADDNNNRRVRSAALHGMMVVAAVPSRERPLGVDTGSTDKIDWEMVGRMLASCGVEVDLPVVSPESRARLGIRKVLYDWGSANNPSSSYGRLLLTFNSETGLVELEQQRGARRRQWLAQLPLATWNHLVDTLLRYQFPSPVTDAQPAVPGYSFTTICWERNGETQAVVIGGRTTDYCDVNRIAMSTIEKVAPGLLSGEPGTYEFPNTEIEAPYELEPPTS